MALTDGRHKKTAANQEKPLKIEKIPFLIIACLVNFAGDMFGPVLDFL